MPDDEAQTLANPAPDERTGRLPEFIIIGAMKSGTTSLFRLLQRHPQIFMCTPKEPKFFSRDYVYARGEQWYRSLFADAREDQVCGEASTCYTRWPHFDAVPGRIAKHIPDVRMIYVMRHPVERAYSHYAHLMQERLLSQRDSLISFEDALESIEEIVHTSLYMQQIEQYLAHFDREQLLFLTLDQLKENAANTLEEIQEFIGLQRVGLVAHGKVRANQWGELLVRRRLATLIDKVRSAPGFSHMLDVTPKPVRSQARRLLSSSRVVLSLVRLTAENNRRRLTPLQPGTRQWLLERFAEPTKRLESFLGRALPQWFI